MFRSKLPVVLSIHWYSAIIIIVGHFTLIEIVLKTSRFDILRFIFVLVYDIALLVASLGIVPLWCWHGELSFQRIIDFSVVIVIIFIAPATHHIIIFILCFHHVVVTGIMLCYVYRS